MFNERKSELVYKLFLLFDDDVYGCRIGYIFMCIYYICLFLGAIKMYGFLKETKGVGERIFGYLERNGEYCERNYEN